MQTTTPNAPPAPRQRRREQSATGSSVMTISRTVGVLYILGTVFGIISEAATGSISGSDDLLAAVAADERGLALGASMVVAMGLVLAMIPIVAYPVLSKGTLVRARGYFLFRSVLETGGYLAAAVAWMLMIPLSGSSDVPAVFGEALFDLDGAVAFGTIAFLIGAAMFYSILYQRRLVPRWLSGWGLVAIIPYGIPVFLRLFTDVEVDSMLFDLPLGLQEMVLAVWLIVKGFASDRAASQEPMRI